MVLSKGTRVTKLSLVFTYTRIMDPVCRHNRGTHARPTLTRAARGGGGVKFQGPRSNGPPKIPPKK